MSSRSRTNESERRELDLIMTGSLVLLGTLLVLFIAFLITGCTPTRPPCPDRTDVPLEGSGNMDPCHRAGERLKELGCKESRPDWDEFCRDQLDLGMPICPGRLAKIKSCDEIKTICR